MQDQDPRGWLYCYPEGKGWNVLPGYTKGKLEICDEHNSDRARSRQCACDPSR